VARIVVAEDDDDIRDIMVRVLTKGGHAVTEAADGAAALYAMRQEPPDAVMTDVDMPVMTGIELCQAIRADARLRDLPVIFVSGRLLPGDTRPADVGATSVLPKPFTPAKLLACLDEALGAGERIAEGAR
jgi:CheY-like chemotaxis protein